MTNRQIFSARIERELARLESLQSDAAWHGVEISFNDEIFEIAERELAANASGTRGAVLPDGGKDFSVVGWARSWIAAERQSTAVGCLGRFWRRIEIDAAATNDREMSVLPRSDVSRNSVGGPESALRQRRRKDADENDNESVSGGIGARANSQEANGGCRIQIIFTEDYLRRWDLHMVDGNFRPSSYPSEEKQEETYRWTQTTPAENRKLENDAQHSGSDSRSSEDRFHKYMTSDDRGSRVAAAFVMEVYDTFPFESPLMACLYFCSARVYKRLEMMTPDTFTRRCVLKEGWTPSISLRMMLERLGAFVRQTVQHEQLCLQVPLTSPHVSHTNNDMTVKNSVGTWLNQFFDSLGRRNRKKTAIFCILSVAVCLRVLIGMQGHSGMGHPPMYGDFEAHRHWMETTCNLPVDEWYVQTPRNDLQYWGLDYPPLSAYHAKLLGTVSRFINPAWTELDSSRGSEGTSLKIFMRASALLSEALVLWPPLIFFWMKLQKNRVPFSGRCLGLLLTVASPILLLVDHGHFQFNSVLLGLVMWSICFLAVGNVPMATIAFCSAFLFKQTAMYFALPIAFSILGLSMRHVSQTGQLRRRVSFALVSVTTSRISSAALCGSSCALIVFAPFILAGPSSASKQVSPALDSEGGGIIVRALSALQLDGVIPVFKRIFPVNRGLYEDYVSNLWVFLQPFIKFKKVAAASAEGRRWILALTSLLTTGLQLPIAGQCWAWPTVDRLIASLFAGSCAWYLFGYHVHEKAILLPQFMSLLVLPHFGYGTVYFTAVSCASLAHLMEKDDIIAPAFILSGFWLFLAWQCVPFVTYIQSESWSSSRTIRKMPTASTSNWLQDFLLIPAVEMLEVAMIPLIGRHVSLTCRVFKRRHLQDLPRKAVTVQRFWRRMTKWALSVFGVIQLGSVLLTPPPAKPYAFVYLQSAAAFLFLLVSFMAGIHLVGSLPRADFLAKPDSTQPLAPWRTNSGTLGKASD